ncbi:hypothetical protein C8R44DRAFT_747039 [Mycena epipterygia]|nr:hypothetical protein C8R44DRAFT_747039 [Mycena epipterygia]
MNIVEISQWELRQKNDGKRRSKERNVAVSTTRGAYSHFLILGVGTKFDAPTRAGKRYIQLNFEASARRNSLSCPTHQNMGNAIILDSRPNSSPVKCPTCSGEGHRYPQPPGACLVLTQLQMTAGRMAPFDLKIEQTVSDGIAAPHGYLVASTGHIAASSLLRVPVLRIVRTNLCTSCHHLDRHTSKISLPAPSRDNISAIAAWQCRYGVSQRTFELSSVVSQGPDADITTAYIGTQKSKNLHIKVFKQGKTIETIKEQDYNDSGGKIILNSP